MSRPNNTAILSGRITNDLEVKTLQGTDNCVLSFSLAIPRPKFGDKEPVTDFIRCEVWGKRAEIIARFFNKGDGINVMGEIRVDVTDGANGAKQYFTKVNVSDFSFPLSNKNNSGGESKKSEFKSPETLDISDDDLPY